MRKEKFEKLGIKKYIALKEKFLAYIRRRQGKNEEITFPQIAKRFNLRLDQVNSLCEDIDEICVNIGFQISCMGYAELSKREWTVEILG